jgi:signal transduction histidine kinase
MTNLEDGRRTGSVQILSFPFARVVSVGMTRSRGRLPTWLSRVVEPQAVAGTRAEIGWTVAWSALATLIAAADVLAGPRTVGAGALSILPVAAASWMLGRRHLAAVVALTIALAVIATALGLLSPAGLTARVLAAVVVAALGGRAAVRQRLRRSVDLALDVGRSLAPDQVIATILVRVSETVQADQAALARVDGGDLVVEATYRAAPSGGVTHVRRHFPRESVDGVADLARALATGQPVIGGRLRARAGGEDLAAALPAAQHTLTFPFVFGGGTASLLVLGRGREFAASDLARLEPMADVAPLALHNADLYDEARQVGQSKSAFLNLAAHELRTPLAVIKGYLSLLEDGTYPVPDETREEAVGTLLAKAQELESLVEALLTTARLEGGTLPRTPGELDVCQAVQDAVVRIRPRARLEGARIELRLPEEDLLTRADRSHVARILDNLLNNALTYSSRPARITMEVRAGDPIELAVRDHGLGIPADQHQRVFERFHRIERSASGYVPGLGLGLAISRELAQVNGGALVLEESVPGAGSVFVLRLPVIR